MHNLFKFCLAIICLLTLSACDFDGLYQKFIPENVQKMDEDNVAAVLAKDKEAFRSLQGDLSDEEYDATFDKFFAAVSEGDIVYKSVVGAEHNSSISPSGKSKDILNVFEIQKGEGFILISLKYALNEAGVCCQLVNLNVQGFEESPVKAGLEKAARIGKIIASIVLFLFLAGIIFLIWILRRNKKNKAQ